MQVDEMLEAATEQELQKLRDQAKAELENSLPEEVRATPRAYTVSQFLNLYFKPFFVLQISVFFRDFGH